ncbi:MAG: hypothetical protein AB1482_12620, partial [Pseudomonadota bacterium]
VFLHHAHGAFTDFRGILDWLGFLHHGSILLGKRASSKSGAVQIAFGIVSGVFERGEMGAFVLEAR